ncbi:MAG TPA: SRPBCC family protein [Thermomicrobiales bacterium]|jgi:hypothetical protein
MAEMRAAAERTIGAPADKIYGVLADYRQHHPNILPPAFFDYAVEQGGTGTGTVVGFNVKTAGRNRHFRVQVAEPEPGRVLTETDTESTLVTRFTVDPDAAGSRVRIETTWQGAGGFGGLMERLFAPRMMQKLFADELDRLDRYVQTNGK